MWQRADHAVEATRDRSVLAELDGERRTDCRNAVCGGDACFEEARFAPPLECRFWSAVAPVHAQQLDRLVERTVDPIGGIVNREHRRDRIVQCSRPGVRVVQVNEIEIGGEPADRRRIPAESPPLVVVALTRTVAVDTAAVECRRVVDQDHLDASRHVPVGGLCRTHRVSDRAEVGQMAVAGQGHRDFVPRSDEGASDAGDGFAEPAGSGER